MKYSKEELNNILSLHSLYLQSKTRGKRANLNSTDLNSADLNGKYACDGKYHFISNIGSERGILELYSCGASGWYLKRGCFSGNKKEFLEAVSKTHGTNEHAIKYNALLAALTEEPKE